MLARRRLAVMSIAAALGAALPVALAGSPATASSSKPAAAQRLQVGVEVLRFAAAGRRLTATGLVTARITDNQGHVRSVRTQAAMIASTGGSCRVLHLYLNQLSLSLLGLHAHLDKVQLDITGNSSGGVLGSLFCRLAKAKVASARAADARAMTAALNGHDHAVRFTAYIRPVAAASAATTTCPVLDLVVGPLNLQLLGLVVNLNQVHLTVTATRGEGALGDLFCKLADDSSTSTSTTTT